MDYRKRQLKLDTHGALALKTITYLSACECTTERLYRLNGNIANIAIVYTFLHVNSMIKTFCYYDCLYR